MKVTILTILMCIGLLFFSAQGLQAEKLIGETVSLEITTADNDSDVWTKTISQVGAGWIKLHFSNVHIKSDEYIVIKDLYGNVAEHFSGSDVMDPENSRFKVTTTNLKSVSFWAPIINGPEVTIEYHRADSKKKMRGFSIDQMGVGFAPLDEDIEEEELSAVKSICGSDDKVSIACAATYYQTSGRSVGRMHYQKGSSWYVCTGFLVSSCSSHFLTNEHCITSQANVDTLDVRFYYRLSTCGGSSASYSTFYGDDFITDDSNNDYCLLTLTGSPQSTWGYLELLSREPYANEAIYIPQHPGGRQQEISFSTISNTNMRSSLDFGYMADTEGGSSGSPVMTDQYDYDKVIGLHHYGGCPNSAVEINQIRAAIIGYICQ